MSKYTAKEIKTALAKRHSKDVFFTEVSTDFSNNSAGRLDAWAMKASYFAPCLFGYEIKVSRADFLQDHKFQEYSSYCNELYIVSAPGVVKFSSELPGFCGWLEVQDWEDGIRLRLKKKATFRNITVPENFWRSMVLHHSKTESLTDEFIQNRYNAKSVEEYLEGKNRYLKIGSKLAEEMARWKARDKEESAIARDLLLELSHIFRISEMDLTQKNVDNIVKRIRHRLDCKDVIEAIDQLENTLERFKRRE